MSSSSDGVGALVSIVLVLAAVAAVVALLATVISILAGVGGLVGGFHAIKNYVKAFRANVRPECVGTKGP